MAGGTPETKREGSGCLHLRVASRPLSQDQGKGKWLKMIRKRRMFAKMFGLLLTLLLFSVFTAQVLFAIGVFSSDKHIKAGLNCDNCHGSAKVTAGAEVGMAKCLSCHGPYEKLAKRTEKMSRNPHSNSHCGDLDCNVCHHGHRADENYCGSCHKE
jgi:hypothetical protein